MKYLRLALKNAKRSKCRHKVGAVLVKGNRILSQSHNIRRNPPLISHRYSTFHAEEVIMRRITPPKGSVLYVARLDRSGSPAIARPCPRCQDLIFSRGVKVAYYTTSNGLGWLRLPTSNEKAIHKTVYEMQAEISQE
ncbi:hypothetical protein ACIQ6V_33435 [Streptomyces sp. NPDC096198]|uniref:hypothetical protein n=1 Tax=Streptomyces sp. NPDC096198 TaxID=3366080 RepID=UPI00380DE707